LESGEGIAVVPEDVEDFVDLGEVGPSGGDEIALDAVEETHDFSNSLFKDGFLVHRVALGKVAAEDVVRPTAEFRSALPVDLVADGKDDVEVVLAGLVLPDDGALARRFRDFAHGIVSDFPVGNDFPDVLVYDGLVLSEEFGDRVGFEPHVLTAVGSRVDLDRESGFFEFHEFHVGYR